MYYLTIFIQLYIKIFTIIIKFQYLFNFQYMFKFIKLRNLLHQLMFTFKLKINLIN